MSLRNSKAVDKSIRRLKALGIKVYVDNESPNMLVLVMDTDSVIKAFLRRLKNMITYRNNKIIFDPNEKSIVVIFYKSEIQDFINYKISEKMKEGVEVW